MGVLRMRLVGIATASLLAAAAFLTSAGSVAAASSYTCTGGSIPAGTYSSVLVQGSTPCTVDAGCVIGRNIDCLLGGGLNQRPLAHHTLGVFELALQQ